MCCIGHEYHDHSLPHSGFACLRNLGNIFFYTFEGFHTDTVNTLEKAGERMKNVFAFARDPQDWIRKLNEVKKSNIEPIRVFA